MEEARFRVASFQRTYEHPRPLKYRDAFPYQNRWIFGKVPKGGWGWGSIPIQKFMLQNLDIWTGLFWHKNDTKEYFQGMFFNNLKRKIRTGHIGKQDTFDPPPPPPPPPPSEHVQKFIRFGRLTLPYIQEAGGVHMLLHSFTSSGQWSDFLDCNFSDLGRECRQCSLFSLLTQGTCNNRFYCCATMCAADAAQRA